MSSLCIGAAFVLVVLLTPTTAINFFEPRYYGDAINFCPTVSGKAQDCDPIISATLYCQRSGYDRATGFSGPVPANSTVAMQLMMDGKQRPVWNTTGGVMERCEAKDGKNCSALGMVYCVNEKMFVNPQIKGKPLDWCATNNGTKECGREAARLFCNQNGFSHGAWSWNGPSPTTAADDTPAKLDTVILDARASGSGPGKVCDSKVDECQTFYSINCEK